MMSREGWINLILFMLQVFLGTSMVQLKAKGEEVRELIGMIELSFYDLLAFFQIVAIFIIARNWDWFGKKFKEFRKLTGWETIDEKFERERQEQQDKWDEERRKRQEARARREFLANKLIKNADVVWRLLNRDKGITPSYSELHEKCELITRTSLTELKKYDFNLPDVLTVPRIGTNRPPQLSPENERFYKNWREFCLDMVPFIAGEEEDRVKDSWYKEYDKN